MTGHNISIYSILTTLLLLLADALPASAFDAGHYPTASVLAEGRWVKVSISDDGLYALPAATLRSWGFTDIERVKVYGLGGRVFDDILTANAYPGDLPQVPSVVDGNRLVFYGAGPGEWTESASGSGRYRYSTNVYAAKSYYYITENDAERLAPGTAATVTPGGTPVTTYYERLHHEVESSSPGHAGPQLVGEDFRYTRKRTFDFALADAVAADAGLWMECSFVSRFSSGNPRLSFSVDGTVLPQISSDILPSPSYISHYTHGYETITRHAAATTAGKGTVRIGIELTAGTTPPVAALNYLSVNYLRQLKPHADGSLVFASPHADFFVADAPDATVWDVTDLSAIKAVGTTARDGGVAWSMPASVRREYALWRRDARLPAPAYEGVVNSPNLHSLTDLDMVIITPAAYATEARRLAELHTADSLHVAVVTDTDIYDEFSGGSPQPAGIRNFLKMLYDRGNITGRPLRYALLFARMSVDNRRLVAETGKYPVIPGWAPLAVRASLSDNEGYITDDFIAMLTDGSGGNLGSDPLCVAVGRIPAMSLTAARNVVDKTLEYARSSRRSLWKMRAMFLADNGDNAVHTNQSESMIAAFQQMDGNPFLVNKIYLDAYTLSGGVYPQAREAQFRSLDEGVVWWNYIGHANETGWTADGQLSYTDLNNMYLRHLPFIYAATCDFLRLDAPAASGAEIMYLERYGGCIGVVSATRPVFITDNGKLSDAMGRVMAVRGADGNFLTPGEMYRRAKNDIRDAMGRPASDENRLRYVFVGDPALRLTLPSNKVRVDSINGIAVDGDSDEPPTFAALQQGCIAGVVTDAAGNVLTDFDGVLTADIFDAERSSLTVNPDYDKQKVFEEHGERVFTGSAKVTGGHFTLKVNMPAEIAQNYRPGSIALYAASTDDDTEAATLMNDIYLYGYDEEAPADTTPPVIEEMFLNHSDFTDGTTVNSSPMLIATVSDNVGLNVSTAGIGHSMTATLDGNRTLGSVNSYYTPSADGTPSGVINFPLENISDGVHTLTLRVWDTSGNSATRTIEFNVMDGLAPTIYRVYSDANPASTSANFYISHNQPDADVTVTVTVYNLVGRPVWSGSAEGRSDMLQSMPVTWDLTNGGGARVPRGIYLYRATITADGEHFETATERIAVTAQ